LPPSMAEELQYADGVGAGKVGAFFMVLFLSAFGIPGSYIMLAGLTLVAVILIFNVSFISLLNKLIGFIQRLIREGFSAVIHLFSGIKHRMQVTKEKRALARLDASTPTVKANSSTSDPQTRRTARAKKRKDNQNKS